MTATVTKKRGRKKLPHDEKRKNYETENLIKSKYCIERNIYFFINS